MKIKQKPIKTIKDLGKIKQSIFDMKNYYLKANDNASEQIINDKCKASYYQYMADIDDQNSIVIALYKGMFNKKNIIGFVGAFENKDKDYIEIIELLINENYRGKKLEHNSNKKLGVQILDDLITEEAKKRGISRIKTETGINMKSRIKMYELAGYKMDMESSTKERATLYKNI